MTVPSSARHLDLDGLADVLAGEGTGERHVRGCASCRERLEELAAAEVAVAAQLATLPSPPLPDGLSQRLADALRAEAARDQEIAAEPGSGAGPAAAPTVVPMRRRRAHTWLPAAAAAAVAVVLAGGIGLSTLRGASDESSDAGGATAAGSTSEEAGTASESVATGTDYADEAARTTRLAALLARPPAAAAAPDVPAADARSLAPTGPDGAVPAPALAAPGSDPVLSRLRDPDALDQCLAALRRDGSPATAPLALDYAAYDGAPALAVVQPDADPTRLVLTVVGPGCSDADPDTRLRTRVARP